jgi:rhodanese-related sulfurtransferase
MSAAPVQTTAALVELARREIPDLTPAQVAEELKNPGVLLVDLREPDERRRHGVLPRALHAPRGMLEFYADPTHPAHLAEFARGRRTILYCACGSRSALAALTLKALGFRHVAHLGGGLKAWVDAGHTVIPAISR